MYPALDAGPVGIRLPWEQAGELAHKMGFTGLTVPMDALAERGVAAVRAVFDRLGLTGSHWGCPVNINTDDDDAFASGFGALVRQAALAAEFGCDRCVAYMHCASDTLSYEANFARMAGRIGRVGRALAEQGLRFGVEYLGPKTLRDGRRYPFIHTLEGMLELLREAGGENLGLLLDSWHWHCAADTSAALEALRPEQVVLVHVNDAPAGVATDGLIDSRREMPGATGIIDIGAFLGALAHIGYDGPLVVEPFNDEIRAMEDEPTAKAVIESLRKVLGTVR